MERRLAAVLIADVAGYGLLSQADEEGTRARFQADLHEIFEPQIAAHHGRLVKTMGDGLLVEFHSVVDALRCAVEVQRAETKRNADLPAARRMEFRIGINLGDVIVEGDDIHGDGVIVAERLQGLADRGGITISGTAYDHVEKKLTVGYEFLGEQPVKNIDKPVRVYRVLLDPKEAGKTIGKPRTAGQSWRSSAIAATALALAIAGGAAAWWRPWEPAIEPASIERMALPLPDEPSIVVLPFANMSDDPAQDYFADGLTEDLTTDLARISGLFVISRNAASTYKGRAVKPAQVAEELGVRYILEGSVRRVDDGLRINAQLVDAISGGHLWAERYDGTFGNVFALQDKVIRNIMAALEPRLIPSEQHLQAQRETSVPAAYDALLKGLELYSRGTSQDLANAVPHLEKAIALDPTYGRAHAALAGVYWLVGGHRQREQRLGVSSEEAFEKSKTHLQEAMKRPSALAYRMTAEIAFYSHAFDDAIVNIERAIALDPSDSDNFALMARALIRVGRAVDGETYIRTAMRLNPTTSPAILGGVQFMLGRYDEAAASLETALASDPDQQFPLIYLIATYGHLGRTKDAASQIERLEKSIAPYRLTGMWVVSNIAFKQESDTQHLLQGLLRAGVPELPFGYDARAKDRLNTDEIRATIFGRTLRGREDKSQQSFTNIITVDGSISETADWGSDTGTISYLGGDRVCYWWSKWGANCAAIFRNPGGAREREDELIRVTYCCEYYFSVIE
jgi:adenylate cyclase